MHIHEAAAVAFWRLGLVCAKGHELSGQAVREIFPGGETVAVTSHEACDPESTMRLNHVNMQILHMLLNIEQHEWLVRVAWLVTTNVDPHQESLNSVQSQQVEMWKASPTYWLEGIV